MKKKTDHGFTLIELMFAMAITLIVMGTIFMTFKSQQDSYVVQDQVTRMQQNLRGAMYVMTRDIQMAGYYTSFDSGSCNNTDLDADGTDEVNVRPLIYAVPNNTTDGDKIINGTDVIVIIKACNERDASGNLMYKWTLGAGDTATGQTLNFDLDLDGDGDDDFNDSGTKFGLLVKSDLGKADFFEISSGNSIVDPLSQNYSSGDLIFRADVIIYRVGVAADEDENVDPPCLRRRNQGTNNGFQVVAEDIDSLQVRYQLSGGASPVKDPGGSEASIRAVEISLLARTGNKIRGYTGPGTYTLGGDSVAAGDGYRRKSLTSLIEAKNMGL